MGEGSIWGYRALYAAIAIVLLFLKLLPIGGMTGGWPGPDILLCLTLAWTMRRPDYLPASLVAGVLLLEDLILMRPPGLWAALVVGASEFIRARVALTRELTFVAEWLLVSGIMMVLFVVNRVVFAVAFLPQPGFGFSIVGVLWSVGFYPIVVGLSRIVLDLRKPAMGEVDAYGRRL